MYQISVIDQPAIQGFKPSPINGKISGANLTMKIAITKNGRILRPQNPVRICAWMRTSQRQPFKYLSTISGKKADLLWTNKAADQGSLTLKFPIALGDLDQTRFPKISFQGAQLKIRADLPQSTPTSSDEATLPATFERPNADLQLSKPTPTKNQGTSSTTLKGILDQGTIHMPLNVIAIGIDYMRDAILLAGGLTMKMWKDLASRHLSMALFKPSTIVVADEGHEIVKRKGKDWTAEEFAQKCIKTHYIKDMIKQGWKPQFAVRLRFQNLDSVGSGDGASDRAWSLMIATDNFLLNENERESKADQIEAVTMSSIWHSRDKAPPKLLIAMRGPFPMGQLSLLDMVKTDGWEIIEQLDELPQELFPKAPRGSGMSYVLLENRLETRDYAEISCPSRAERAKSVNETIPVAHNLTGGQMTKREETTGHDSDVHCIDIATQGSESPDLQITQIQASPTSILPRAREKLDQGNDRSHEAPDSLGHSELWAKRRDQLEERRQARIRPAQTGSPSGLASIFEDFI